MGAEIREAVVSKSMLSQTIKVPAIGLATIREVRDVRICAVAWSELVSKLLAQS